MQIRKLRVIADTSFLMISGLFGVDVTSELDRVLEQRHELMVPKPVLDELKRLAERGTPAERSAAYIGLVLAKRSRIVEAKGTADEAILNLTREGNCVAATTDAALRRELRKRGVPVIYLREQSHLAIDGKVK